MSVLSCSEGLTEVTALEASLEKPEHIRVLPGRWKWTTEEPWPKLEMVLATKFWSDDMYKPIRELLRHPMANPEIIQGGEFITVDTTARKVQAVQPPPQPRAFPESSPPTATDLGTEVIDETPLGSEEPSSTQPTQAAKPSAAADQQRSGSGLIHVVGMKQGNAVPETLMSVKYRMVFIELGVEDMCTNVHNLPINLMLGDENVVVVVVGNHVAVAQAVTTLESASALHKPHVLRLTVTTNTKEDQAYSFSQEDMCIISRKQLPWKAWTPAPSSFLLHLCALNVNRLTVSMDGQGTWGHGIAKRCDRSTLTPLSFSPAGAQIRDVGTIQVPERPAR